MLSRVLTAAFSTALPPPAPFGRRAARSLAMSAPAASRAAFLPSEPVGPSAKRLVLVRHGEVQVEKLDLPPGSFYGCLDVPLSDHGCVEARAAAALVLATEPDASGASIACSPLSRAVTGAVEIGAAIGVEDAAITRLDGFREVNRGSWVGLTKAAVGEQYGEDALDRFHADPMFKEHGGESLGDVGDRVLEARDVVVDAMAPGSTAIVVSHLWVTRAMLAAASGKGPADYADITLPTASVSCVELGPDGDWRVLYEGRKPPLADGTTVASKGDNPNMGN